ncbi:MAG: large subunit ribosomal protein [Candidatus Peribacteria bacterium]|nr:large subunit ribosomal protein [Candidatus Peribacteria bacterium]
MKIRTGDTVIVIAGKDKGKTGTVLRVLKTQARLIVTGINMRTKHVKKTHQQAGQKLVFEASLHASNVMILDPKTKKASRIGYKVTEKGKKRVALRSGEEVVKVKAPKAAKKDTTVETAKDKQKKKVTAEKNEQNELTAENKQPFWKKMKFGSAAIEAAEVDEGSRMTQDQTIPNEVKHVRSGSRGS